MSSPQSAVLYWHMGATTILFRNIEPRIRSGWKSVGALAFGSNGVPGETACFGVQKGTPSAGELYALGILKRFAVTKSINQKNS